MIFSSQSKYLLENIEKLKVLEQKVRNLNIENKNQLSAIEQRALKLSQQHEERLKQIIEKEKAVNKIISEKALGFPWLADAISEFYKYQDVETAKYLETKKHPAYRKADKVRELAAENKLLRKQLKVAKNFVKYYETLFPWLTDYVGDDLDDLLKSIVKGNQTIENSDNIDPVLFFVPKGEYDKLSSSERNQKALDRYSFTKKRPYEIGRDYERYIGYLYERKGYTVDYFGIENGLEDLGRDLVCTKGDEVIIVQCKYWAKHKTIHEKHINQLYGTAIKFYLDHKQMVSNKKELDLFPDLIKEGKIKAHFVTSTKLSETAKNFAAALGIQLTENFSLGTYPMIKCNISTSGEKIYHLPFDQQYDKTIIKNKGEFYAFTVKEAEEKGFRRAFRWQGNS